MIILAEAERAKDIAIALGRFRDYDPDNTIPNSINQLKDLSQVLRELARLIDVRDGVVSRIVADDLELLQHSVAYTLQDLWTVIGRLPDHAIGHDYRDAWKQICLHCRNTRKQSLPMRIETYCLFAAAICRHLRSDPPSRQLRIEELRADIMSLRRAQLDPQNRRLISAPEAIQALTSLQVPQLLPAPTVGNGAMRQPRSQERVRPPNIRTMSPTEESNVSWDSIHRPPVNSPASPQSPTAAHSSMSQTSGGEAETSHWAGNIFDSLPSTELVDELNAGKISECYPYDQQDGKSWPNSDSFEHILRIKFPGGLRFHYYVRGTDCRAKAVCQWPIGRRNSLREPPFSCLPLNELHVKRERSILFLCRAIGGLGGSVAWAQLRFPTIEYMIIFHCTFLALRSYDAAKPTREIWDNELKGETKVFAAAIRDNGYKHALRIYRDRMTGTMRLEASVLQGPLKNTPIWTAFITHLITSPRWTRKTKNGHHTVYLADLRRHIFSADYQPHVAASGEHILDFDEAKDAAAFEKTIKDFGRRYGHGP